MVTVPRFLRIAFVIHFVIDMAFALPLLFVPAQTMAFFGFTGAETFTARLVGAALIGIGGTSLLIRNKGAEYFDALLDVKLLWSGSAILGIILAISQDAPSSSLMFLGIFVLFFIIWMVSKGVLSKTLTSTDHKHF